MERLAVAGVTLGIEEVRDLVTGVISALAGRSMNSWMELIAPGADEALRRQLEALRHEIAAAADPGFVIGPVPRQRLDDLRAEMATECLDGLLVPRGDAYQSEYVPARADRMRWLTGFTGSAGLVVVLAKRAAIFVDGRYALQVRAQMDGDAFEPKDLPAESPAAWIAANLGDGGKLAYDPWLHTEDQFESYSRAAAKAGGTMVQITENLIDRVWEGQPAEPIAPIVPHDIAYAGRSAADKCQEIAGAMAADGIDTAVVTAPDSIAWLLNVRGGDVPKTPLPMSRLIIHRNLEIELFVDARKPTAATIRHLGDGVTLRRSEDFGDALEALGGTGATVQVDPGFGAPVLERQLGVPFAVIDRLQRGGATVVRALDPCALPKAFKNEVEIQGARNAHRRDGVAMVRFLVWMAREASSGGLTELEAAARLDALRLDGDLITELSISTISGTGPNSALPHYRPTEESNRRIEAGQFYLCDSGAQYLDGTTDITRTIAIGTPTPEMKDRYTRVLKAHIALATARFPDGISGLHLDGLTRRPLWDVGLDFNHGTGHGVGSHLNVHEGPHYISKAPNTTPFGPGVIISNEPGYYKAGAFGVRIENLVVVVPCIELGDTTPPFLTFETLTVVPIDMTPIEPSLMTPGETAWLDGYHRWVRDTLGPLVDGETAQWLEETTRPLGG